MLRIPIEKGNINKALKNFKIKFKKTGVLNELKERKHYTKPSLKRKLQKEEAIRKLKQQEDE
jgi:small subunit ribosomal protein S21